MGLGVASSIRSHLHLRRGALPDAEADARFAMDMAYEVGSAYAFVTAAHATLALVALERGDSREALERLVAELEQPRVDTDALPYEAVLHGRGCLRAALGDDRIVVHDVEAHHGGSRLVGAPADSPFRVRVVRREQFGRRGSGTLAVAQVRPHVARDLALDVRRLLASGATFEGEPIKPRHVAVISYRHADLADTRAALQEVGVPAVIAGGGSVFATPALKVAVPIAFA